MACVFDGLAIVYDGDLPVYDGYAPPDRPLVALRDEAGVVGESSLNGAGAADAGQCGAATPLNDAGGDMSTEIGPIRISSPGVRTNCKQAVALDEEDAIDEGSIVLGATPAGLSASEAAVNTLPVTIAEVEYPAGHVVLYTLEADDGVTDTAGEVQFAFDTTAGQHFEIAKDVAISRRIESR